jgi:hypothetical protein
MEVTMAEQKSEFKKYESLIYRWHRIGSTIQFENGFYQAKNKGEEKQIESDSIFGTKIFVSQ